MARIKYYYDTESCKYERVKVSTWDIVLNASGFIALAMVLALGIYYVVSVNFKSPVEAQLEKENQEFELHNKLMMDQLDEVSKMLSSLQERDDNVYRVIFEAEPIPSSIRNAGVGGVNRYKDLMDKGLEREELILEGYKKMDKLKKQMYIQTKSYDELIEMASKKEEFFASIPAIQPVSNRELKRLSSGFGWRTDPILKTRKMHKGVDFAAPRGTPVYTTGNGVVKKVKSSITGYGKQIEIDHGYGYVTKYAHLNAFNVKKGQKVRRGECIGYVGNTGKSTAAHLHYEVIKDNIKVNPVYYFYQDLNPSEYEEILRLASIENQSLGSHQE